MKNNREMEGPKYKRNKEKKKSRRGHVACRKEGGSFLLFKIRLRVIIRKGKGKKNGERVRQTIFERES